MTSLIPFGFRFHPTEHELISYFLKNKILGRLPPLSNVIIDAAVYGPYSTPWETFSLKDNQLPWQRVVDPIGKPEDSQAILYVFTKLSNVGNTDKSFKKQKNRVAGCGSWHGNTSIQPVYDNNGTGNIVIGYRRTFTFRSDQETVGQWTMYEYTINPTAHGIADGFEDYVLCKIKMDGTKTSKAGKLISRKRNFTSLMISDDHQGQLPSPSNCNAAGDQAFRAVPADKVIASVQGLEDLEANLMRYQEDDMLNDNLCFDADALLDDIINFP